MTTKTLPARLDSSDALALQLKSLLRRDKRLQSISEIAGPFDVRLTPPGFAGLVRIVCGQQLSVASARAIWSRFEVLPGATDPERYLGLEESAVRAVGFSAGKYRTVKVIAEAIVSGALDLPAIEALSAEDAVKALTSHKGIGPWTAEIYLMFCAGHPDVFPSGDLALQKAVGHALGMESAPNAKALAAIATEWSPHRHAAALLFWRYYATVIRKAEGIAL